MTLPHEITLDDGQVLSGPVGDLTQHELISLANQLLREKKTQEWRAVMEYQHRKFYKDLPPLSPLPPKAA